MRKVKGLAELADSGKKVVKDNANGMMRSMFLSADIGIAFSMILILAFGLRRRWWKKRVLHFFVFGFLLGSTWEIVFLLHSPHFSPQPWYEQSLQFPLHPIVQTLVHSTWDAGLLLAGYALVLHFFSPPYFRHWNGRHLGLMVCWGQLQELSVEIVAITSDSWNFLVFPWNPALFYIEGRPITVLPQATWLVASLLFYVGLLLYHRVGLDGHKDT